MLRPVYVEALTLLNEMLPVNCVWAAQAVYEEPHGGRLYVPCDAQKAQVGLGDLVLAHGIDDDSCSTAAYRVVDRDAERVYVEWVAQTYAASAPERKAL